jgi:hypothetical protein
VRVAGFVASAGVKVLLVTDTDAPRSVVTAAEKIGKFGWCPRLVAVV